jgi:L-amino acid N-acyltransferase
MITVRLATENDLPQMLEIYNDVILNTTAVFEYNKHTFEMRKQWFETKKNQGYPVFSAVEGPVLVGFSSFGPFRAWPAYKYSVENSVYVHNGYRGKGIGKLLMKPLIDAAIAMNLHTIVAGIEAENKSSIRLHASFGFIEVAHFKEAGFKFNRWLDLKFLQLMLTTPENPVETI